MADKVLSFKEKLISIQTELKAPKGQFNNFGKYKYRSCEDILEAVKPLLAKYEMALTISDDVVEVGQRIYVKATATIIDAESNDGTTNVAWAREDESKKGMDGSQITGTASSYARKYCLNGLFLIDDTKDADTDEYQKANNGSNDKITDIQLKSVRMAIESNENITEEGILKYFKIKALEDMTVENLRTFIELKEKAYGDKK